MQTHGNWSGKERDRESKMSIHLEKLELSVNFYIPVKTWECQEFFFKSENFVKRAKICLKIVI